MVVVLCALMPVAAYAADPVLNVTDDGAYARQKYYDGEDVPAFPDTLTKDDVEYELVSVGEPTLDSSYAQPRKYYSGYQYNATFTAEEYGKWSSYFPATYAISDGYYQGSIPLSSVNPYTVTLVYEKFEGQVDCTAVFEGLPDNDVNRLPATKEFTVRSDSGPDATQVKALTLVEVTYEITARNNLGLPVEYEATATYRGAERWLELIKYDVLANYAGYVNANVNRYIVEAEYEPVEVVPVVLAPEPTPKVAPVVEPVAEPVTEPFPWGLVAAAVAIVLMLGAFGILMFLFFKNACLVRGTKLPKAILLKRSLMFTGKEAVFKIPKDIDIFDGQHYEITLRPWISRRRATLIVEWDGRVVAMEPFGESIVLPASAEDELVTIGNEKFVPVFNKVEPVEESVA
jgi:hypothetical protein